MFNLIFGMIGVVTVSLLVAYFFYRSLADLHLNIRLAIGAIVFFTLYFLLLIVGYKTGSF